MLFKETKEVNKCILITDLPRLLKGVDNFFIVQWWLVGYSRFYKSSFTIKKFEKNNKEVNKSILMAAFLRFLRGVDNVSLHNYGLLVIQGFKNQVLP